MIMKHNKLILIILICVSIISIGIVGIFHSTNGDDSILVAIGEYEIVLTGEQSQRLKDSTLYEELEIMNSVEHRSVLLFLNAVREEKLIDHLYPNDITHVARMLYLLDIGMIQELKVISYNWQIRGSSRYLNPRSGWFINIRFISEDKKVYHLSYSQTWGLQRIAKENEDDEVLYDRRMNALVGGNMEWFSYQEERYRIECFLLEDALIIIYLDDYHHIIEIEHRSDKRIYFSAGTGINFRVLEYDEVFDFNILPQDFPHQ